MNKGLVTSKCSNYQSFFNTKNLKNGQVLVGYIVCAGIRTLVVKKFPMLVIGGAKEQKMREAFISESFPHFY